MAFDNQGGGFNRVMHTAGDADGCAGNWACSKCQTSIKELPFPPDPARLGQLLCKDCHRARKESFGGR
ncbi:MAG: hypothetical protein HY433_01445 [Candidatus Liptonbacteria bacterium]|nr:hypothetical protein [Candidatus Liptonbacteria bacterium]